MFTEKYIIKPKSKLNLSKNSTSDTWTYNSKDESKNILKKNTKMMQELQDMFYAYDKYSMLIIFQAMDAAGKDGTIKHVMSGLNPQGVQVYSFKQPSTEELDHGYLWRITRALPERGRIGIFNRSHYEDVLVVRVHNLISKLKLPDEVTSRNIWDERFAQINNFEKYLEQNGTKILKFFLHVSKEEQKERFLARIDDPAKNWKFSSGDVNERKHWDEYQKYYEEAINATSTDYAPWFVIPADKKWYMRLAVSNIILETFQHLDMHYPQLNNDEKEKLNLCKEMLMNEKD